MSSRLRAAGSQIPYVGVNDYWFADEPERAYC
jgi:hypothetical protein